LFTLYQHNNSNAQLGRVHTLWSIDSQKITKIAVKYDLRDLELKRIQFDFRRVSGAASCGLNT